MSTRLQFTPAQAGEALRRARETSLLTQEEAGAAVGVTRQTIAAWEHGQPPAAAAYVLLLASQGPAARHALLEPVGIPPDELAADYDPELERLIQRIRSFRGRARWPDARSALAALLHVLEGSQPEG